jgi:muconolactone delta-isomerase
MQRPTLSRMYETFIKIDPHPDPLHQIIFQTIKTKVYPTIEQLKKDGKVDWYSFLIHNRRSGVPTTSDDNNAYFHIRFSLSKEADKEQILKSIPDFCVMTRKVNPSSVESISISTTMKFNPSLLKQGGIEEIWRIIGDQSEFFLNVFERYKDDVVIPVEEIWSLLHYFHNMVGLSAIQCQNCKTTFLI